MRDCPPSQALGMMVLGGSSLPHRTGEPFSFNTTAAQPQVRPPRLLPLKGRNGEA